MDHLSKFHQNRTVNESKNTILRKLRKPEKWWRLVPRNQELDAWRYKTSARRFLLREKSEKQHFFMKRTLARIT